MIFLPASDLVLLTDTGYSAAIWSASSTEATYLRELPATKNIRSVVVPGLRGNFSKHSLPPTGVRSALQSTANTESKHETITKHDSVFGGE
ncbi:hypothetical protein J6590_018824 [Homalodisca vitripennis]|nr:hypothetical protein J6590_018824 [Homalodisca vitripennis]